MAGVGLGLWTAYDINHQVGNLVLAGLLVVGGLYAATLPDEG